MSKNKKIREAKRFISAHKNNDICDWLLLGEYLYNDEPSHIKVYDEKMEGADGCVLIGIQFDEYGDVTKNPTGFSVIISASESASGNSVLFEWEINCD